MRLLTLSRKLKARLVPVTAYCLIFFAATQALAQDFVVVANSNLGSNTVSSSDIEQMLLGNKSTWPSGERVIFCLFNEQDTQAAFLKQFINKTPIQFKSYWKKLVFTGKGRMPKFFDTKEEVKAFVKEHPGAFSFLPAPGDNSLKILAIK